MPRGSTSAAYREKVRLFNLAQPREDVAEARDVDADGVPCRLFTPDDPEDGVIVHVHGGGFVFNDIDVHDGVCRRLANRSRRRVLSVGYRKPPERRFPAAIEDIDTVPGWLEQQALPGEWAIHGDSAGANLALVGALRNPGRFRAVVLIYPFLDPTAGFDSYEVGEASGFGPQEASWYWEQYADRADWDDPDVAPLHSDQLEHLPPTFVATAEFDPAPRRGGRAGAAHRRDRRRDRRHQVPRAKPRLLAARPVHRLRAAPEAGRRVHRPAPVDRGQFLGRQRVMAGEHELDP
ncbi:alpha/beta hydrolase [Nocardioides sp. B-3]|uniref:alpha/beta hydrolase n=1 Tax=Nocardioides sp. B-3 TaxID=2895565 RepID=UPI002152AF44|nr:alpha/beta hydrolase [Nocardioides sp. B-3]UUZ60044.1 alpha/beta hydrolase [Nocardioides sp. B-3]